MTSSLRSLSGGGGGFQWPWQYHFPPFFTVQVNSDTRAKQLEAWCRLVLDYHRAHKSYVLDTSEAQSSPLFSNEDINRRLPPIGIDLVLKTLESRGNVEWQNSEKTRCLVMWRSPREWGELVYKWAQASGHGNSVCTLYELHSGEDTTEEEFHEIELWVLQRSIQALAREGKAELIPGDSADGSDAGVKFFS
jgi:ESCRT-II complex subunit VPS25